MSKKLLTFSLLLSSLSTLNAQIVTNGSFENVAGNTCDPNGTGCTPCFYCGVGTQFDGWMANDVDLFNKTATGANNLAGGVPDGDYAVDLNGRGPGTISQVINASSMGGQYTLSFYYSNNDARATCNQDKPFQVNIYLMPANVLLYTETVSTAGLSVVNNNWATYSRSGTVPSGVASIRLEIKSLFGLTSPAAPVPNCGVGGNPNATVFGPVIDFVKVEAGVVPLKLVSFNGNYSGNSLNLTWKTENEVDVAKMNVQYFNGTAWQTIATVLPTGLGRGNTYSSNIAASAINNKTQVTLRLEIVDINGAIAYSRNLGLANNLAEIKINLSPNPTNKGLSTLFGLKGGEIINIYNSVGQQLSSRKATSNAEKIDLSAYTSGVYTVTVVGKDGKIFNTKLVKN